jgi:hypothetical protein
VFIGHFAVALAAKKVTPRTSLGTLVMAAQFADLLWPVFVLLGLERVAIVPGITTATPLDFTSYPFSHSLLADIGWASLFAGFYQIMKRNSRGALCLWFVVMSHWVLDFVTHRPDLPLYPGSSTFVGLGLWNSRAGTILVEVAMYVLGTFLYTKVTRPRNAVGVYAFWSFIGLLLVMYFADLFGPPPPSVKAIALAGLGLWLFVAWAYWIDRNRLPVSGSESLFTPQGNDMNSRR